MSGRSGRRSLIVCQSHHIALLDFQGTLSLSGDFITLSPFLAFASRCGNFFHELSGAVSRLWFPKRLAAQFLTLASPFSFASQPGDFFGGVSWLGDWSEDFRGAVRHLADEDIR